MNWAIAAHISPKNGCIHNSKFPSAGNVHGNKNYTFPQCKYCLHIADFHQPTMMPPARHLYLRNPNFLQVILNFERLFRC